MKKSVVLEIWGLGDGEGLDYSPHNKMHLVSYVDTNVDGKISASIFRIERSCGGRLIWETRNHLPKYTAFFDGEQ